MVRPSCSAAWRRLSMERAWSACDPWEKFRRATSMPSCISSRSAGSVRQDGPMVQMILARRRETAPVGWHSELLATGLRLCSFNGSPVRDRDGLFYLLQPIGDSEKGGQNLFANPGFVRAISTFFSVKESWAQYWRSSPKGSPPHSLSTPVRNKKSEAQLFSPTRAVHAGFH